MDFLGRGGDFLWVLLACATLLEMRGCDKWFQRDGGMVVSIR